LLASLRFQFVTRSGQQVGRVVVSPSWARASWLCRLARSSNKRQVSLKKQAICSCEPPTGSLSSADHWEVKQTRGFTCAWEAVPPPLAWMRPPLLSLRV